MMRTTSRKYVRREMSRQSYVRRKSTVTIARTSRIAGREVSMRIAPIPENISGASRTTAIGSTVAIGSTSAISDGITHLGNLGVTSNSSTSLQKRFFWNRFNEYLSNREVVPLSFEGTSSVFVHQSSSSSTSPVPASKSSASSTRSLEATAQSISSQTTADQYSIARAPSDSIPTELLTPETGTGATSSVIGGYSSSSAAVSSSSSAAEFPSNAASSSTTFESYANASSSSSSGSTNAAPEVVVNNGTPSTPVEALGADVDQVNTEKGLLGTGEAVSASESKNAAESFGAAVNAESAAESAGAAAEAGFVRGNYWSVGPSGSASDLLMERCMEQAASYGYEAGEPYTPWANVDFIQSWIIAIQDTTNCSFGTAIVLMTLMMRSLTFPLAVASIRAMRARVLTRPEENRLREKLNAAKDEGNAEEQNKLQNQLQDFQRKHGGTMNSFKANFFNFGVSMPLFITVSWAARGMAFRPEIFPQMAMDAPLHLDSLSLPDPYMALPLVACGIMLTNVEVFRTMDGTGVGRSLEETSRKGNEVFTDKTANRLGAKSENFRMIGVWVMRGAALFMLVRARLPAACFIYIITSSLWSSCQNMAFRLQFAQLYLDLPVLPNDAANQSKHRLQKAIREKQGHYEERCISHGGKISRGMTKSMQRLRQGVLQRTLLKGTMGSQSLFDLRWHKNHVMSLYRDHQTRMRRSRLKQELLVANYDTEGFKEERNMFSKPTIATADQCTLAAATGMATGGKSNTANDVAVNSIVANTNVLLTAAHTKTNPCVPTSNRPGGDSGFKTTKGSEEFLRGMGIAPFNQKAFAARCFGEAKHSLLNFCNTNITPGNWTSYGNCSNLIRTKAQYDACWDYAFRKRRLSQMTTEELMQIPVRYLHPTALRKLHKTGGDSLKKLPSAMLHNFGLQDRVGHVILSGPSLNRLLLARKNTQKFLSAAKRKGEETPSYYYINETHIEITPEEKLAMKTDQTKFAENIPVLTYTKRRIRQCLHERKSADKLLREACAY